MTRKLPAKGTPGRQLMRAADFARWRLQALRQFGRDIAGNIAYRTLGSLRMARFDGASAARDRVGIFVIFPTRGVLQTHLSALSALDRAGYSPLVVSNVRLSPADRAEVLAKCWRLIERPNFGYDFGAFRDGIRHIGPELHALRRLVLMNDSTWFPVPGARDWLTEAEALGADMVGAVWNHGLAPADLDTWRTYHWALDPTKPGYHYCSFALSLGPLVLQSAAFRQFWRHLWLTDDKIRTVESGELGLSRTLIDAGFSHTSTIDLSRLDAELDAMPLADLEAFLRALVIPQDPDVEAFRDRIVAEAAAMSVETRRPALRQAALAIVAKTGPAYAMPRYLLSQHGYAFLKKSPMRLSRSGALETLEVARRLQGPDGKAIHDEAQSMLRLIGSNTS